jgi:alkylation response protein AidB-like acyl-CoA dehydrogenase
MPADLPRAGAELQARLGDATDPDNPLGYRAVVAADERGETLPEGERALDDYALNAEFVPRSLGGRFTQADRFAVTLRTVFRRDPVLGLGYGVSSFIGAVPVWTSGNPDQRRWLADLLLGNGRVAAGYTELAHGGDFSRASLRATRQENRFVISGGKQLISNVARARALTLFARTDDAPGSRSHSHLLVDLASVPADRLLRSRRFPTSGMRGLLLGGVEFHDCAVPADSLVGELGAGIETVLKAFQVTRSVFPGMATGVLDTQLRLATRFALARTLYGRPVADLPQARTVLIEAFLDLLISDCLATVAARALHVLPTQTSVYAAAVKYLVPILLHEANYNLSTLLGARSYLREGPYAVFQKNTRDLPVAMLAHASGAACQATVIAQLPRLASRSWLTAEAPPPLLFRLDEPLPELDFTQLSLSAKGADSLSATLLVSRDDADEASMEPELAALCGHFAAELSDLKAQCEALPPRERLATAGPASFDLVDRYATVLAANACFGVWRHNQDHRSQFLRGTPWVVAVLRRLAERLDAGPAPGAAHGLEQPLFGELRARHDEGRSFDLSDSPVAG